MSCVIDTKLLRQLPAVFLRRLCSVHDPGPAQPHPDKARRTNSSTHRVPPSPVKPRVVTRGDNTLPPSLFHVKELAKRWNTHP